MRYLAIAVKFFREYWAEVERATRLTVELWQALLSLAPKLAKRLASEEAGGDES